METITSLQNPRFKQALRLHTSRGRQAQGRIIVFGDREVARAIDAKLQIDELFVADSVDTAAIQALQVRLPASAKMTRITSEVFTKLAYGDRSGTMIATATRPETLLDSLRPQPAALILVVQSIEKPGNLGAIIRSADAAGVSAVILADPLTDCFHPNSIRSSTAAVFSMPMAAGTSSQVQTWLSQHEFNVFPAILENAQDFFTADLRGDVAIVLGNEARGLDDQWSKPEFFPVKLPMNGQSDSLNVSVTSSVMIYEAFRQRRLD
jgi:TrmH family RNA methyltransferase